ncbi:MAG: ArsR/SmtB family transcription factor [Christensenellales bacterium]
MIWRVELRQNCEESSVEYLEDIKWFLPNSKTFCDMADIFAIYADPTRLKILTALSLRDMCVGDLATVLNLNQTTLSHQLRLLKNCSAVKNFRSGKSIVYSLAGSGIENLMSDVSCMINQSK